MICRNCGKMVLPDDGHIIDSAFYCEECSVECIECGEYILKEAATETYDGNFICEDCYYDNYSHVKIVEKSILQRIVIGLQMKEKTYVINV